MYSVCDCEHRSLSLFNAATCLCSSLSLFSLRTGFDKSPFSVDVPILHLFASAQDVDTVHLSEAVPHRGGVGGERGGDG